MKERSLYNLRGCAWFLSVVFVLMATVSGASWQCLDGHPCPPGCTMQQSEQQNRSDRAAAPLRACCVSHRSAQNAPVHCTLCSTAHAANSQFKVRCTSPICVLRTQMKPDADTHTSVPFVLDAAVTLPLPVPIYVLLPEETGSVSFGSSRAPPQGVVVCPSAPRAPPIRLS